MRRGARFLLFLLAATILTPQGVIAQSYGEQLEIKLVELERLTGELESRVAAYVAKAKEAQELKAAWEDHSLPEAIEIAQLSQGITVWLTAQ